MKTRSLLSRAILLCSLVVAFNASTTARVITPQDKKPTTNVPEAEAKAAKAIEAATDVNAKFVAAEEFVKKYPASKVRPEVAQYLATQVFGVTEPNQRLAASQKYLALFTDPAEVKVVKPALIDSFVQLKRFDEAFESGVSYLVTDAEDVQIRVLLALAGAELARGQNMKHIKASRDYGTKAIELLEPETKSAGIDNDAWVKGKAMLPTLYQQMAVMSLIEQKPSEAQVNLEKAVKLNPADPFNYALLGSITNNEYQTMVQTIRGLPDGASKNEMLRKATALLDKVIEQYARSVALATGKPQYQPMRDQLMQDLVTYYKYRHNNSDEGLQKYIDGYKLP